MKASNTIRMHPLERARNAKGLTIGQFAHRLGVTRQAARNWELGVSVPSPEMFPKIAEVLGITALDATELIAPSQPA